MSDSPNVVILQPGEGRLIDLDGFTMTIKATAADTAGAFSLMEAKEPPGMGPPLHIHHDAAESFYVLAGEYIIFEDDREISCKEGSFVYIPAGVAHGFRVGSVPSRKLNFYTPAGMVGYFDDLKAAIGRGDVEASELAEIANKYSMEVLGPVPESYA